MSWGDSFMECDVPSSKRARLPATPSSVDGALALGGTIAKSEKVGINRKQGENLDYRLRVVEAHIFDSFRVNTDQLNHPLLRQLKRQRMPVRKSELRIAASPHTPMLK